MGQCNKCKLRDIKEMCKELREECIVENAPGGGIDVYVVPKGEKFDKKKHHLAWFMSVGSTCECEFRDEECGIE